MIDSPLLMTALYRLASYTVLPILPFYMKKRLKQGKEDALRMKEKYGYAAVERPEGNLIWLHAASVGELVSSISLIKHFHMHHPEIKFLVTSGTTTSAQIANDRLGNCAIHQFAPLDSPLFIKRFLSHWRPDLVLWLESELWPNQLQALKKQKIPTILLNARLSNNSFQKWQKYRSVIQSLLSCFNHISAQSPEDRQKLSRLAKGRNILFPGNLKMASAPLAFNPQEAEKLRQAIGERPIIVAASTHKGEEEIIIAAHKNYSQTKNSHTLAPLTIIVPRHPERGQDIAALLLEKNCLFAQRSKEEIPNEQTEIYLADSLGELGLFYHLADITLIGGSLLGTIGGHNPVEPALLNCAIIHGPDMNNFASIAEELADHNGAFSLEQKHELSDKILGLLEDPKKQQTLQENAYKWANSQRDQIIRRVEKLILTQLNTQKQTTKNDPLVPKTEENAQLSSLIENNQESPHESA